MKRSLTALSSSVLLFAVVVGLAGCPAKPGVTDPPMVDPPRDPTSLVDDKGNKKVRPPVDAEKAPAASERIAWSALDEMSTKIASSFSASQKQRLYLQVDKPLYKPGETIWLRVWDLKTRDLAAAADGIGTLELISPKGAAVVSKMLQVTAGQAANDVELPAEVPGGEYKLRFSTADGTTVERPVIVSRYEAPRIKKKLEFVRKAYGANDVVSATLELKRPTGEPLANQAIVALLRLDGVELPRVELTTDKAGNALVKVPLPSSISVGDGLLTILVEDGGVTESISKAVPIVMKRMDLAFFPEGGALVTGLESRVYFEAKTALGKPADVAGEVVDDRGQVVARFESYKEGLGRFAFIPGRDRTYKARITKPEGIIDQAMLPAASSEGCVLRTYDDLDGQRDALVAGVTCTTAQKVVVVAAIRDNVVDTAAIELQAGKTGVVELKGKDAVAKAMGVTRVTVFAESKQPLAERIVFQHRRARLGVKIKPIKDRYGPREQVALQVTTTSADGKPIPAELAMAVVDDTVIALADDKTGHILSRLYLEPELPGVVEEPNVFFDLTEEKSALAMELLMGTRGWRTFAWEPVFNPPPPVELQQAGEGGLGMAGMGAGGGGRQDRGRVLMKGAVMPAPPAPGAPPMAAAPMAAARKPMDINEAPRDAEERAEPAQAANAIVPQEPQMQAAPVVAADDAKREMAPARARRAPPMQGAAKDNDWDKAKKMDRGIMADIVEQKPGFAVAAVRVFPAPSYGGTAVPAVRTDFRETISWTPQFKTGADGTGIVTFFLSDAVTSFRVFSEGVGAGVAGRDETVFDSKLPFSMSVKLPVEVSAGDRIDVPLTLTNERDSGLDVDVKATFGDLVTAKGDVGGTKSLAKNARDANFYSLDVTGISGTTKVSFSAAGDGLKDEFERELVVVPRGFPIEEGFAGTVKDKVIHSVDTGAATAGSIEASVRLYPSPTATLIAGLEGMLREPSGCFEQTSSTNYPNVMIVSYLERNNIAAPEILERSKQLMESGYNKLVGFETKEKGYEWFGGAPGHEALTAYGLLEFMDMKAVYGGVDDAMILRTGEWLKARRDGKGGYSRNSRALDSFGGANPAVTDAYITYSLSEARIPDVDVEVNAQLQRAPSLTDPYLLALATNTMFNAGKTSAAEASAKKLAAMQDASGAWLKAEQSITRSGPSDLNVETTALSTLALLKSSSKYPQETRKAVEWLMNNRSAYGQWGATQATVLSLKAMLAYIEATKKTQGPGSVIVQVNGKVHKSVNYEAGHKEPIIIDGLGALMTAGKNDIKVLVDGQDALPYTIAVSYRSLQPASSPDTVVDLKVVSDKSSVKMGEPVRVTATLTNKTDKGQPMTLARIGIPGGLSSQDWQLKKLREDQKIAFYETRAREVILYFRDLAPNAVHEIPIDLVALVPGSYTAPASSAYLYYTNENKVWADALKTEITH